MVEGKSEVTGLISHVTLEEGTDALTTRSSSLPHVAASS